MGSKRRALVNSPLNRRELLQYTAAVSAGCLLREVAGAQDEKRVATTAPADPPGRKARSVAILVFDGVELLDFAGPAEVFIAADHGKAFRVSLVAQANRAVRTIGNVAIVPEFTFENVPRADIIVIPGGEMKNAGKECLAWLKHAASDAEIILSVCWGAFLLAEAGLLDGIRATTHHLAIDGLEKAAPRCTVLRNERFVDSGKIISAAGVTAGIDGALHVVQRLLGYEIARWTAEVYMEHPRQVTRPGT